MNRTVRLTRHIAARVATLAMACLLGSAAATAQAPSAEQVEIFRNLTPEQQQAILEGMGGSGGTGTDTERSDARLETPDTIRRKPVAQEGDRKLTAEGEPMLAADDTLIVELELLKFEGQERILTKSTVRPLVEPTSPVAVPGAEAAVPVTTAPRTLQTLPTQPISPQIVRTPEEIKRLEALADVVARANPYRLDRAGAIDIPGLGMIQLAGLTAVQATQRLAIDPLLREFRIRLTWLPLEPVGPDALKPFGYDLFAGVPSTFAPVTDVPVPAEYVIGPGDRIDVQLIGNSKGRYTLTVNRDGRINFPELGPVPVSGMRFEELKARIEQRVNEQMIGTQAVVTMGDLRSIRVFVLGEAERPGSYTVSGLSTITNALFASGGVKTIGSLRDIQLKRNGAVVKRLDLYALLLKGDTSDDARLLPGDVIFIPPVAATVGLAGEVRRPAIYELKGESTAADLLYLGGGLTPEADARLATLERIDERRQRVVIDVDLSDPQQRGARLHTGDILKVPGVRPMYSNAVSVEGHVHRPKSVQYRPGLRLTDLLTSVDDLKPNADLRYVLVRREQPGSRHIEMLSADLVEAWRGPGSAADPLLMARDRIYAFDLATGRATILNPLLQQLRLQAVSTEPSQLVRVTGRVRVPGEYPLETDMTVSDLIRAGGGLSEEAYGAVAELARYEVRDGETRKTDVVKIDLARAMAHDPVADLVLAPYDFLVVKEISQWASAETVLLEGEVRFPGEYPIERGETLRSVIARAGGLTPLAFPNGSVFTRETLKEREKRQIEILADRLKQDLGTLALQGAQATGTGAQQASETLAIGQSLLADLRDTEPVGRLVIDLDRILQTDQGATIDVILKDGDVLRVPKTAQEVTVIGEVQNSTSHLFDPSLDREGYIRLSGGTTQKADDKRIYVVRANGSVEASGGSRWRRSSSPIQPGDTIVVPLDAERMRPLPLWTAVSTILYNIAVAVAAVNSF